MNERKRELLVALNDRVYYDDAHGAMEVVAAVLPLLSAQEREAFLRWAGGGPTRWVGDEADASAFVAAVLG